MQTERSSAIVRGVVDTPVAVAVGISVAPIASDCSPLSRRGVAVPPRTLGLVLRASLDGDGNAIETDAAGPNTADIGTPLADACATGQDDTPPGDALGGVTSRAHTERSALAAEICARAVTG